MRSSWLALSLGITMTVFAARADAFCRTTTCDPRVADCDPPAGQECTTIGAPLYWPKQCVGFSLQQDASPTIPYETFSAVTQRAFQSWLVADCGGQPPNIDVVDLGPVSCAAVEYNQYAGNANIITFRNTTWPYESSSHTLALTTVTFNTENAQIYDVDIEINAAEVQLTTTDDGVQYDLEAILAHELGHFFGLAHSGDSSATMYARYKRGTTDLRTPEPDDYAGMCAIYPPGETGTCDPTPRRGLQTTCGDGSPPDEGGCSIAHGTEPTPVWALVALIPFAWLLRRKRSASE